jgi:hypothetical protein
MPSPQGIQFTELAVWMQENSCTFRKLEELSGLDKMTLQRLVKGSFKKLIPSWIPAIARATGGLVGQEQFFAFIGRLSAPKVGSKKPAPRPAKRRAA